MKIHTLNLLLFLILSSVNCFASAGYVFVHEGNEYVTLNDYNNTCKLTKVNPLLTGTYTLPTYDQRIVTESSEEYIISQIDCGALADCEISLLIVPDKHAVFTGNSNDDLCLDLSPSIIELRIEDGYKDTEIQFKGAGIKKAYIGRNIESDNENIKAKGLLADCGALEEIVFGNSVTEVPSYCCFSCTSLSKIEFNDKISHIGSHAFQNCKSLKTIKFPAKLDQISDYAFKNCGLTEIKINESIKSLGDYAFADNFLKNLTIPPTLNKIGNEAFSSESLSKITIEDGENDIIFSGHPFEGYPCELYLGRNIITESPYYWDKSSRQETHLTPNDDAFNICTVPVAYNVSKLHIGKNVKTIGPRWFMYCPLTSVTIPATVELIFASAFDDCMELEEVIIEDSEEKLEIKSMGYNTDYNYQLEKLFEYSPLRHLYLGRNLDYSSSRTIQHEKNDYMTLPLRQTSPPFSETQLSEVEIGPLVSNLENHMFYKCDALESIEIPRSIISLEEGVFRDCRWLKNVKLHKGIKEIGPCAFDNTNLTDIELPDGLEFIDRYAFRNTPLTSLNLPNSLKYINDDAFLNSKITEATLEDGDNESYLFFYVMNTVKKLNIYRKNWEVNAWSNNLKEVTIGGSATYVPGWSFDDCKGLSVLNLGLSVTHIQNAAFKGCDALNSVRIPLYMKTIDKSAFENCKGLRVLGIAHTEQILENAFANCPIEDIVYCDTTLVPQVDITAFTAYGKQLYVRESMVQKFKDAEIWKKFIIVPMVEPERIVSQNPTEVHLNPGETTNVSASVLPANVFFRTTIYWVSTDPEIASVTFDGTVTYHGIAESSENDSVGNKAAKRSDAFIIGYSMYGMPIYFHISGNFNDGVESISESDNCDKPDYNSPYEIFTTSGINAGNDIEKMKTGLYIIRQANKTFKVSKR